MRSKLAFLITLPVIQDSRGTIVQRMRQGAIPKATPISDSRYNEEYFDRYNHSGNNNYSFGNGEIANTPASDLVLNVNSATYDVMQPIDSTALIIFNYE